MTEQAETTVDYDEVVNLNGLHDPGSPPLAGEFLRGGHVTTTTLSKAVRIVMEEWALWRRPSAIISRSGGQDLGANEIAATYSRSDFPSAP